MLKSRTKNDLMIEVWETLDCENVGAKEIIAIEKAVRERFGEAAVDSPMVIARLLADEGAELRSEEADAVRGAIWSVAPRRSERRYRYSRYGTLASRSARSRRSRRSW